MCWISCENVLNRECGFLFFLVLTPEGQIINAQTQQVIGHVQPPQTILVHNGEQQVAPAGQQSTELSLDSNSEDSGLD